MLLHIIGTGCPTPVPAQFGSAFGLEVGAALLLIDCGPATTYKMVRMGLRPQQVEHVFLTHHHFDHTADVACLALTRWDLCVGPEPPLTVCGPRPTRRFIDLLLRRGGAYAPDWQSRLSHPASLACHELRGGSLPRPAPRIDAQDLTDGDEVPGAAWRLCCRTVRHVEPGLLSLAYRVDTAAGSVVFAGDCADCPELRALAAGADTLVMACTHYGVATTRPEIAAVITGTQEAAAVAGQAHVQRLVLSHSSPGFARPGARDQAVAAVAREFGGVVCFPEEMTTLDLAAAPDPQRAAQEAAP